MTIEEMHGSGFGPSKGVVRPGSSGSGGTASGWRQVGLVAVLALAIVGAPASAWAEGKAGEVGKESGLGAAAAISSLVYGPVKLVYATGGLIVGAFAWAFTAGDSQVAEKVFTRSLRGTYVITPEILMGEDRLEFIGRDGDEPTGRTENIASAEPAVRAAESFDDPTYDEMGW